MDYSYRHGHLDGHNYNRSCKHAHRYKYERFQMYKKIENIFPNFRTIPKGKGKFIFLMSQQNVINTKILVLVESNNLVVVYFRHMNIGG